MFNLEFAHGSVEDFTRPYTVLLSESTAQRYFANEDAIGKTITFNGEYDAELEVVGIYQDFPTNTSLQLDLISNIETCYKTMWGSGWVNDWQNMFVSAYIKIKPETSEEVTKMAQTAVSANYAPERPQMWKTSLQKLTDIHLAEPMDVGEPSSQNDFQTIVLFTAIGLIILCLGCFNFINMVTAQAGQRAKEVGVRKVLGSSRKQISQQTFFETTAFLFISGVFAWVLMYALLPQIGELTFQNYTLGDITNIKYLSGFISAIILTALLAGAYPALHISRINTLFLMRKNHKAVSGSKVRNTLVTAQFTIISGLIICTFMVYLQMKYIQDKDLGFDDSTIVNMPIQNDELVIPKINAFKEQLNQFSGIGPITAASHEMLSDYTYMTNFIIEGFEEQYKWERYTVEQNYLKTFDLELVAGRDFNENIASDSNAFVVNESVLKALNLTPEQALGLDITDRGLNYSGKIIGVVKDFHFRSLHHDIQPFVMYVNGCNPSIM